VSVPRTARTLVRRLPGVVSLHERWTAARVRHRRQRQWGRAHTCVVSFPKSGRTWLHVMLARLAHGAHAPFVLDVPGVLFTHDDADKPSLPLRTDFGRYADRKVVLLVRDPRDVLVSYFAHRTRRDRTYDGTLSASRRSSPPGGATAPCRAASCSSATRICTQIRARSSSASPASPACPTEIPS
jgi:hypothetical protein